MRPEKNDKYTLKDQRSQLEEELTLGPSKDLTRRDFLRYAGYGTAALTLLSQLEALRPADAAPRRGFLRGAQSDGGKLQLPFWSDGANWNQPQYYQTIQAGTRRFPHTAQGADINGDGQDELLARGPNGLETNVYDPASGQWVPIAEGSGLFSDASGWNHPQYYGTIQTGRFNRISTQILLARSSTKILIYYYDKDANKWMEFDNPVYPAPPWSNDHRWDQPQYYETIQGYVRSAEGQNMYIVIGRAPDDDPNGKGIQVWSFEGIFGFPDSSMWTQMPPGPPWTDANGWNKPEFYQTIQCANVDGNDGSFSQVLVGQGPNGMEVWYFDINANKFVKSPQNIWESDQLFVDRWNYSTIQFADIDGDNAQECLVNSNEGIMAWKMRGTLSAPDWVFLGHGPLWYANTGWAKPEYYETIQCADIDGDGQFELIARAPDNDQHGGGVQVWKFVPGPNYPNNPTGTWKQMPGIPNWKDANGWNQAEYYQTIQTAIVKTPVSDELPNPQAVILGRGSLGMQTWYYDPDTETWQQTSASFPAFTPSQQAAYVQLDTALRGADANGNIRSIYNDEEADFDDWLSRMYSPPPASYDIPPEERPHTNLPLPAINPPSQEDWDAVTWQIYWEMSYVGKPSSSINDWYGNKVHGLINTAFLSQDFTLQTVGDQLQISQNSTASVVLSILELLANVASAIAGFPELNAATAGAISSLLGAAFTAASDALPGGGFQVAYAQLQTALSDAFDASIHANTQNQFAITGGTDGKVYVPGDWGLMSVIGPRIHNGVWDWPSSTDDVVAVLQRSYAITVSQALLGPLNWRIYYNSLSPPELPDPSQYPTEYLYYDSNGYPYWFGTGPAIFEDLPAIATLQMLFDPIDPGIWNPLQVPKGDVVNEINGWPELDIIDVREVGEGSGRPAPRAAAGVDLRTSVRLSRDAITGEIVAAVTLLNRGWTPARNVELTAAQLKNQRPLGSIPARHTFIARAKSATYYLRFPSLPAGQTVVLRVSGRYLKGTFGGSFRVKLP